MYEFQNHSKPLPPNFTVVHICAAHIMHQISQKIPKNAKREFRDFTLGCFTKLIESSDYSEQKEIMKTMETVIGSKYMNDDVRKALENYSNLIVNNIPIESEVQERASFLNDEDYENYTEFQEEEKKTI